MFEPDLTTTEYHSGLLAAPATGEHEALVAQLAEEMAQAWLKGLRPGVEHYLKRHGDLNGNGPAILDLLYEEIRLRHEFGESVDLESMAARFPALRQQIEVLVQCVYMLETGVIGGFPAVGEVVGEFQLLVELGRGSQGRVFVASQSSLGGRPVVLKITTRGGHEHLSLARLQHTHIVPLLSVHDEPDRNLRVLCMPYFGGMTLAAILETLQDCPPGARILEALDDARRAAAVELPPGRDPATPFLNRASYVQAITWLGACLAEALKYAHERGLVHLDIKPSNVLLTADRQPMLLDFHLAREPLCPEDPGARLGGTPLYMSPEQKRVMANLKNGKPLSEAIDGRSDIYSLGLVLRESLGGGPPSETSLEPLCRINPQVPLGLSDIVAKCLASEPAERYQDAGALAADLWGHLNDLPLRGVANRSLAERWHKWRRRKPHMLSYVALLTAVLAVASAALAMAFFSAGHRVSEARRAIADGERRMASEQFVDAADAFERGFSQIEKLPGYNELKAELTSRVGLAKRAQVAQKLHQIAERFRGIYGADLTTVPRLASFEADCREFWEKRDLIFDKLGKELDPKMEQQVQFDLLDLAILGGNLRVGLSSSDNMQDAHRDALRVLDEAENQFGPSRVLYRERQRHAEALGQADVAEEARRRAAGCPARTAWESYAMGRALLDDGDLEKAAVELDDAVAKEPSGLWPHFYQGICSYRLGRYEDAAMAFTTCTALAPKSAGCFVNRALAFIGWGHRDKALKDLEKAIELEPEKARVVFEIRQLLDPHP